MSAPLRFDQWMQRALYDPESGYYSRHIKTVGGRGDFTTAPMTSDHLAKTIAKWAAAALKETGTRDLIEIGPGCGTLAKAVWKHLPLGLRIKCRLHLVETSTPLEQQQRELLGKKASWHPSPEEALKACEGRAVIYSNELVDAFPCHRYELTPDGWMEIGVQFDDDQQASEVLLPPESAPESSIFSSSNMEHFSLGQRVEVHSSYRDWLQVWLPQWKAGRMLTIDYGAEDKELYQRRKQGSMRAYLLQQRLIGMDIYDNMGRQDLTADVNFTDLMRWSLPWITENHLQSLGEFLANSGAEERLLDPQGAGGAFKVLEQRPN